MSVLLIAGSPSERSRSATLLAQVGRRLAAHRVHVETLNIRNLDALALLQARFDHPDVVKAAQQVANATVIVVATPVYKAAYSGVLKVFLDLLAQTALQGKTVLPLATGGSPHHMLALDYALRPVLQALGAKQILTGIYATDAQVTHLPEGGGVLHPDVSNRVDVAVQTLLSEALQVRDAGFAPVRFEQVQLSV
ncbi:NADPH-dependent FMN reductase [Diaphorobacter ruginosibacter]|uniref:NADPH-dependent FMN reductase n=1 Tax=Diaphorobacter ruginosibacter TaxID=1715720 RepID=UPI003341392F